MGGALGTGYRDTTPACLEAVPYTGAPSNPARKPGRSEAMAAGGGFKLSHRQEPTALCASGRMETPSATVRAGTEDAGGRVERVSGSDPGRGQRDRRVETSPGVN